MYYTEYLPRLNSISVVIESETPISKIVNIKLNFKNQLILKLQDNEIPIDLPIRIRQDDNIKVISANQSTNSLSLTISVPSQESEGISEKTESFMNFSSSELNQRWSCKDLKDKTPTVDKVNEFKFCCIFCSHKIIDSRSSGKFYDMPSELWSEMMEFWHCHKPANEEGDGNSHRKYNGDLKPKDKDIIIGSYYLILNESKALAISNDDVKCSACNRKLGYLENNLIKIMKWNLLMKYGDTSESFPSYLYVYNLLLDKINLSAIRKFKIKCNLAKEFIFVWVMNIGVDISTEKGIINNSLRLFYYLDDIKNIGTNDDESIETLKISDDVFNNFLNELTEVNKMMPKSKQNITIKEGNVSNLYNISFLAGL